jgi:hypothetical protein
MPDDREMPHGFSAEGAKRIVDVVRRIENLPRNLRRDVPAQTNEAPPRSFWLAQNSAFQGNNSSATTWTIYSGTFGTETATSITSFQKGVFVRWGICFANLTYILMEINGGFEVLNPTLEFRGTANADITSGSTGTVSIFYKSAVNAYTDTTSDTASNSVLNALDGTVKSGSVVQCVFDPYISGGNPVEGWRISQAAFSC